MRNVKVSGFSTLVNTGTWIKKVTPGIFTGTINLYPKHILNLNTKIIAALYFVLIVCFFLRKGERY